MERHPVFSGRPNAGVSSPYMLICQSVSQIKPVLCCYQLWLYVFHRSAWTSWTQYTEELEPRIRCCCILWSSEEGSCHLVFNHPDRVPCGSGRRTHNPTYLYMYIPVDMPPGLSPRALKKSPWDRWGGHLHGHANYAFIHSFLSLKFSFALKYYGTMGHAWA